jgi:hypothetical protein
MTTQNRIKTVLTLAVVAMAILAASARAATMSSVATAPVVNGEDIASYGTPTGQDKWWPGSASAYGNPGKTVGQTFTTGNAEVLLNAFTFQVRDATQPTKEYTIRVGTVSGTTFTGIYSETATQSASTAANDYWTWTLDSPVVLSANTVYGVDVGLNSSTSEWTTGIPYVYYTADVYADGTRFRSGTAGDGIGDTTMTQVSGDRVFHLDLLPADPNLPSVDAGPDMISWSGAMVALDPNVVNNDTTEPQGTLTYLWTAEPNGIGDPNLDVAITGADTENASITITKTATGDVTVVTMTLAVTLEGKEPVTDSMTIDVYDDSCLAAKAVGLAEIDPTDFDENCITNFADFAVLAATWLDDYALTGPVAK